MRPILTPLAQTLPDTVSLHRPGGARAAQRHPFRARVGANESGFGPSPRVSRQCAPPRARCGIRRPRNLRAPPGSSPTHLALPVANLAHRRGHRRPARTDRAPDRRAGRPRRHLARRLSDLQLPCRRLWRRVVTVPYSGNREDLEAARRRRKARARQVVYLANPDNPMGTWWTADRDRALLDGRAGRAPHPSRRSLLRDRPGRHLARSISIRPNLMRTRTFSKAYGLAGMRVGYAIGEPGFIKAFDKCATTSASPARLVPPSPRSAIRTSSTVVANIAAGRASASTPSRAQRPRRRALGDQLRRRRLRPRRRLCRRRLKALIAAASSCACHGAGLDRYIRISVGRPEELDVVAEQLPAALAHPG